MLARLPPRVATCGSSDHEALDAFHLLSELEGIVPALETAHALAYVSPRRARAWAAGRRSSSTSRGAATRTSVEVARLEGVKL